VTVRISLPQPHPVGSVLEEEKTQLIFEALPYFLGDQRKVWGSGLA
jgi:hypothetical protein